MGEIYAPDIGRFITRYSIGRDGNPFNLKGSPHFLRVKVPGGFISSEQFRRVAQLAAKYGRGQAEITDRQDIQLHWIEAEDSLDIFAAMDEIGFTTDMCGQSFAGTGHGDVRNILCCPVSGIEKDEILDVHPTVERLTKFFIGNPDFMDLPRKFKTSISGCGSDCTRAVNNDLALVGVKKGDEVGFTLLVGGSVGASLPGPRLARFTGVFIRPEDAFDVVVATVEIHRDYGNRESKAKARFKWLIEGWGVEKFLTALEERLGRTFERYDGPVFLKRSDHEGVQPQKQDGCHYVNIPLLGGRLTSDEMVQIAGLADEYGSGELRLTPTQSIIMLGVKEKDVLLRRLEERFSFGDSKLLWNSIACASDFCGKTQSPHTKEVLKEVVTYLNGRFDHRTLNEADFRIHVSGCPNDCCASGVAEIGLSGKIVMEGNKVRQSYDLCLGGHQGIESAFGRLIEERVSADALKYKIKSLLTNYMSKRRPSETLREFCRRHTDEELKAYLNTSEG